MPTIEWLKKEFSYGYDSGDVLSIIPRRKRRDEQQRCGASYRRIFMKAIRPRLSEDSTVMELGPGAGSWTRAILRYIPRGTLYALDFQDAAQWLEPERYEGRLKCLQVSDNSFSCMPDRAVDFFWSFGVLCHNDVRHIGEILCNSLPKMKPGGYAVHQYGDWDKLELFGWKKSTIPQEFKDKPDDEIWWPRNTCSTMVDIAERAGWQVVSPDMDLIKRDGLILLRCPLGS